MRFFELSSDDESAAQSYDDNMKHNATVRCFHDFECYMRLLGNNKHEFACKMLRTLRTSLRDVRPSADSSDETMEESRSLKIRRYNDTTQDEISAPDMWADVHHSLRSPDDANNDLEDVTMHGCLC
eukprot:s2058_g5.t1